MAKFKLTKLAIRFIAIFLVLSLVPVVTVTVINSINYRNTMLEEEMITMSLIEHWQYTSMVQIFESVETNLLMLADNPLTIKNAKNASTWDPEDLWATYEGAKWDAENASAITKTALPWNPDNDLDPDFSQYIQDFADNLNIAEIFITDDRGYAFTSGSAVPGDFYQKGEEWWNNLIDMDDRVYTYIDFEDSLDNYVLAYIVEIIDPDTDEFLGMMKAALDTGIIDDAVNQALEYVHEIEAEGLEHSLMIISADLTVFYHEDNSLINTDVVTLMPKTHTTNKDVLDIVVSREEDSTIEGDGMLVLMIGGEEHYAVVEHLIEHEQNHDYGLTLFAFVSKAAVDGIIADQVINSILLASLFALLAIIAGIALGLYLSAPIVRVSAVAKSIEEGDLTVTVDERDKKRGDEIGTLALSIEQMIVKLREIISVSLEGAQNLSAASQELASTSEEVNATTEEIAATIQQISRGSSSQSELSAKSMEEIGKMAEIVDRSLSDIDNTLTVIEDIAGQTNILALNAAIEAARAGEHGRGFAVVADNVRKLAEETSKNSKDIDKMTKNIVQNIGGSVKKLQESFQDLAAQAEEFSASTEEVAAGTEEQTAAMHQMTSSAQELTELGENLLKVIAHFRTSAEK